MVNANISDDTLDRKANYVVETVSGSSMYHYLNKSRLKRRKMNESDWISSDVIY